MTPLPNNFITIANPRCAYSKFIKLLDLVVNLRR
jgi:hypothetical protein